MSEQEEQEIKEIAKGFSDLARIPIVGAALAYEYAKYAFQQRKDIEELNKCLPRKHTP